MADTCARCGKPAKGYATINDERYCHGDQDELTCYVLASRELTAASVEQFATKFGITRHG